MKREREGGGGGEREQEREGGVGGGAGGDEGQMGESGGNTGTSHELNRTANSSTRVGEEGETGRGRRGRAFLLEGRGIEGGWGGDRSLLHYATHTYTHTKKTGHKLHFRSKLRLQSEVLSSSAQSLNLNIFSNLPSAVSPETASLVFNVFWVGRSGRRSRRLKWAVLSVEFLQEVERRGRA